MTKQELMDKIALLSNTIETMTSERADLQKQLEEAEKELKPGDVVKVYGKRCMVLAREQEGKDVFWALRQDGNVVAIWSDTVEERHNHTDTVDGIVRMLRARDCFKCQYEDVLMLDEPCASCIAACGDEDKFKQKGESNDD